MRGFAAGTTVDVSQASEVEWKTGSKVVYFPGGIGPPFIIPEGFHTDFASVPRIVVWFLPRYGLWTLAAILHDWLWRRSAPAGRVTWREADRIFREAMYCLGVPYLRRWVMWSAVRLAAVTKGQFRDWLMTAPGALFFAAIVMAFMLVPGLVVYLVPGWPSVVAAPPIGIAVVLVVWHLFEWMAYAVARLFHRDPVEPGFDFYTARKVEDKEI